MVRDDPERARAPAALASGPADASSSHRLSSRGCLRQEAASIKTSEEGRPLPIAQRSHLCVRSSRLLTHVDAILDDEGFYENDPKFESHYWVVFEALRYHEAIPKPPTPSRDGLILQERLPPRPPLSRELPALKTTYNPAGKLRSPEHQPPKDKLMASLAAHTYVARWVMLTRDSYHELDRLGLNEQHPQCASG